MKKWAAILGATVIVVLVIILGQDPGLWTAGGIARLKNRVSGSERKSGNRAVEQTIDSSADRNLASQPSAALIKDRADLERRYPGPWLIEETDGRLKMAGGVAIPIDGSSAAERSQFLEQLANYLGVLREQLKDSLAFHAQTAMSVSYSYSHEIDGIPVFNSYVSLLVRSADNKVVMVTSNLTPFQTVQRIVSIDRNEAEKIVMSWSGSQLIEKVDMRYFVQSDGVAERAWSLIFRHDGDKRSVVLISAVSGEILIRQSAHSH